MELDYYEITAELDAREILRYLNNLGIQNISGEVLKYFITDLKKLIKYDLEQKYGKTEDNFKPEPIGPERLHSASTFSSRIRSRCQENLPVTCGRDCHKVKSASTRVSHSAPILGQTKKDNIDKPMRRACSCVRVERKLETASKENLPTTNNNNLIKVPVKTMKKKCDPVSLYHYYTSLWAKYKPNVPGENDWSELRWHVRQKMAGCHSKPLTIKVHNGNNKNCPVKH